MMFNSLDDLLDAIARRGELPEVSRRELDEVLTRAMLDHNDRRRQDSMIRAMRDLTGELRKNRPRRGR